MFGFFKRKKNVITTDSGADIAINGLNNISYAIDNDLIVLEQGQFFNDIYSHFDYPNDIPRVTYVMFSPTLKKQVIARCAMVMERKENGLGIWSADWAVKSEYRGQGFGSSIVTKAIHEFTNSFHSQMTSGFYLEAIVSVNNIPSNNIASKLLGNRQSVTNPKTKEVINSYLKKYT